MSGYYCTMVESIHAALIKVSQSSLWSDTCHDNFVKIITSNKSTEDAVEFKSFDNLLGGLSNENTTFTHFSRKLMCFL